MKNPEIAYFALRATPSGHLVIQTHYSHDLVVLDRKLKVKLEFNGKKHSKVPVFREPHFSFEGEKMIWFGGNNSISIVDLRDLSQTVVSNLLPEFEELESTPEPKLSIADFKASKLMILYEMDGESLIVYNERDRDPDMYILPEKFDDMNNVNCMDLSKDKSTGFLGGETSLEMFDKLGNSAGIRRCGCITVFNFDSSLMQLCCLRLEHLKNASTVVKILLSEFYENLMYVLTSGPLLVTEYDPVNKVVECLRVVNVDFCSKKKFDFFCFC